MTLQSGSNGRDDPLFQNLYIFEMANNHQGSVEHGKRIITEMGAAATRHGVRAAVKLQYRDLDTFIHPEELKLKKNKHVPRFLSTRLNDDQFAELAAAIRNAGMLVVITPFDEASVDLCIKHNVDILKVASCSADDWPLMERVAQTERPVIISTGGLTVDDIDNVYSFFSHRNCRFAMLHCVSIYPTPPELQQLNFVDRMRARYPDITIGYSGHEHPDDLQPVAIAMAKGATIFERHVGVETDDIKLNAYSMNPVQVDRWLGAAVAAKTLCGTGREKLITEDERLSLLALKRGVFARKSLKKGAELARDSVYFAFPAQDGQLVSGAWRKSLTATRAAKEHEPLHAERELSDTELARRFIHMFRGMFNEAGIHLGLEFEIELSHHYGLANFRETGALIANVVNRDYCKKLVAQLPGQSHPCHRHMEKEEVFQVLSGTAEIVLNDVLHTLEVGDLLLVRRGDWHSFSSKSGVIFEEISSRHIIGDSYYQDEAITALDPMERKTILEAW